MRGYVLRYLGLVGSGEAIERARARVPGIAVRLARSHVIAAGFETEHGADEAHVHRLAYLRAIGRPAIDPNAIADVRSAFEAKRDRPREDRAAISAALGAVLAIVVLGGAGAGAWIATRPAPRPPATPAVATEAVDLDALLAPEHPVHPLTEVFRDRFAAYVVALDQRSAGRERAAPDDVASTRARVIEALQRLAPELVAPMTGLFDASESYESHGDDDLAWSRQLVALHDVLAREDVPFYVDAQLTEERVGSRRRLLFQTYDVLARRTYVSGALRIDALELERLDSLNTARSLLGYTRPEVRYALVLVDRIERFLVEKLLPSMHGLEESVFVRGYEDERDTHWVTPFEEQAHEDLREEARAAIGAAGLDAPSLDRLADAIVRRRRAITDMSYVLRDRGIALVEPREHHYDVAQLDAYGDGETGPHLRAVREAQQQLDGEPSTRVWEALLSAHVRSVAQHEVQHRLDFEAGRMIQVPPTLAAYTGETESEDRVNRLAERANAELSAYLSQVARQPAMARTELLHVASFPMSRDGWRMAETYAAIALFEAMAEQAGITHGPLVAARRVQRGEIAAIYAALRARDGAEIAALARAAWAALYGEELAPLAPAP